MNKYDSQIYWQAMYRQIRGLTGDALRRTLGRALQARYEEPAQPLPPALDELLGRLHDCEQGAEPMRDDIKRD